MKVKIKRIDKSLPLPEYKTGGSVAFDLYSRIDETIEPGEFKMLPSNLMVATPEGYMLMLSARSSSAKKKGLTMRNSVGIIDQDYCGDEDEIHMMVHNFSNQTAQIQKGERIAQATFIKVDIAEFEEVNKMSDNSRGGFGSTGDF